MTILDWITTFEDYYNQMGNPYNDAIEYGVQVVPAQADGAGLIWRCLGIHLLTGPENNGKRNVFVEARFSDGGRASPQETNLSWRWEGGVPLFTPFDKPLSEPFANFPLDIKMAGVSLWVNDFGGGVASDLVSGISTNHRPDHEFPGSTQGHMSYFVYFKLSDASSPGSPPTLPPDITDPLTDRELDFIMASLNYAKGPAPGFPGHHMILLVAKLAHHLGLDRAKVPGQGGELPLE